MQLCSGGRGVRAHDEVCYEGSMCPVCEKWEELAGEIAVLQSEITDLEKQVTDLENS